MTMPPLPELAVFMALILALALYGLAVSGHFPSEHRAPPLRDGLGAALLWGTMALALLLLLVALVFAAVHLPVYAAVIGGGAMLLAAPLLLQPFPDSFVNGRSALLTFAALGLGLALLARALTV